MKEMNLKNMVVLKNLPSNIVEEAIVILKNNLKVKELEKIDKNKTSENKEKTNKSEDYIIKEAEMLITNYIAKIEQKKEQTKVQNIKINQKYKKVKRYAYIASIIMVIQAVVIFIK